MGYNVRLMNTNLVLPRAKQDQILVIWKAINAPQFDSLKYGGSWGGGKQSAAWYSWMPENYHNEVESCQEVLELLGFDCDIDERGDIAISYYDSKVGQENLFFTAISHLIPDGSFVEWLGEDGERFNWKFKDGVMYSGNEVIENPFIPVIETKCLEDAKNFLTNVARLESF